MNEDYCYDIEMIPPTEEIIKIVSQNESAVGYDWLFRRHNPCSN